MEGAEDFKKHVHLHIDDPTNVIPQNKGEQARRNWTRDRHSESEASGSKKLKRIGFLLPISVPLGTVIGWRGSRDAICSLRLFCAGVADVELAEEYVLEV